MNIELVNELHWDKITIDRCDFRAGMHVDVLRLDKIHPVIEGNKWFKLQYYLEDALRLGFKSLLSFGGAHSNHIVAVAYAAKLANLQSIGVIRGEKPETLSAALIDAMNAGMELSYLSREEYRQKNDPDLLNNIREQWGDPYVIPEGGYGKHGVRGAEEILANIDTVDYSHIACAVGTGTMLAGIANVSLPGQTLIGISVMKGNFELKKQIDALLSSTEIENRITINQNYHFGGYAKNHDKLIAYMNDFYLRFGIPTDFVYTAKLMYGLEEMCKTDQFAKGNRVLIIHSGGLQGNRSLTPGMLAF